MIELQLFGDLRVMCDGVPRPLPKSKKTRALLAYLAITQAQQTRTKLCSLLWECPGDPRAELRWSLTKLRRLLGDGSATALVGTGDSIQLVGVATDLGLVRRAIRHGSQEASTEDLLSAATRFTGDLLEGLELPDCYGFEQWLRVERERARQLHVSILSTLVERLATRPAEALEHARRWVAIDPLSEAAHAAVMLQLRGLGREADALEQYASCVCILDRELGRRPSRELERIRMTIGEARVTNASPAMADDKRRSGFGVSGAMEGTVTRPGIPRRRRSGRCSRSGRATSRSCRSVEHARCFAS